MSDDIQLKLQLLQMTDGNIDKAQAMWEWLRPKPDAEQGEAEDAIAFRDARKITELREDVFALIGLLPSDLTEDAAKLVKEIDARLEQDTGGSALRFYARQAALTPIRSDESGSESETAGSDALAEFMKREGAVEWDISVSIQPRDEATVEVLFEKGIIETGSATSIFDSKLDGDKGFIRAYRIISQPEAKGEDSGEGEPLGCMEPGGEEPSADPQSKDEPERDEAAAYAPVNEPEPSPTEAAAKVFREGMVRDAEKHASDKPGFRLWPIGPKPPKRETQEA